MMLKKIISFSIFFSSCLTLLSPHFHYSQKSDPFYVNLLDKGEKSFIAGNYKSAIKDLEIAAFGLLEEKKLKAKAYVYIGLSYYYLRNLNKSKEYLNDAVESISEEKLLDLDLDESARIELKNLLNSFKLKAFDKDISERGDIRLNINEAPEKRKDRTVETGLIKELEKTIQVQPRNIELYYKLCNLYIESGNIEAAKNTLKNLIKNNPAEINGYYLLGKIEFKERNYKEAEKIFEKILDLSKRIQIDERIIIEVKAYLILCSYLRGKRKKSKKMVLDWIDDFSREKIITLTLDIQDKEMLERIIEAYKLETDDDRKK